ncbi:MAG: phage tail family protein [Oscillospiraceae bacterium]|jgi:hypothetical protein|nr:phage tail family protein [Oscillospiraceae bacterium]
MELIYQNARGRGITLETADSTDMLNPGISPFILTAAQGLYDLRSEAYVIDPPERAGSVRVSSRVTRRLIVLEGFIAVNVPENRRRLTACFSPLVTGWLTLRRDEAGGVFERRIGCAAESGLAFDKADGSRFTASLIAPSPWWEDTDGGLTANLTGWIGGVAFPWSVVDGFQFGGRASGTTVNVVNPGDVSTGMTIKLFAADDVERPAVIRPGTGEAMRITATLEAGDAFEIGTEAGEKYARYVHADGTTVGGMRYVDPDSVFLQLEPGDNLLRAEAVSGGGALTATASFRPKYLSV